MCVVKNSGPERLSRQPFSSLLMLQFTFFALIGGFFFVPCYGALTKFPSGNTDETQARNLVNNFESLAADRLALFLEVEWTYSTNITDYNKRVVEGAAVAYSKFRKEYWESFWTYDWKKFSDRELLRKFKLASVLGLYALEEQDYKAVKKLQAEMEKIQNSAKICSFTAPLICDMEQDYVTKEFANPVSEPRLRHIWVQWHNAIGRKVLPLYAQSITYANKAALGHSLKDFSDVVISRYESNAFLEDLNFLWEQLKPLFFQLHAYVRRKLILFYGAEQIKPNGCIPAHLTGDISGISWQGIENITKPFSHIKSIDVTPEMIKQNISIRQMYRMAEKFFTSLGLNPMTNKFWANSLFEKPLNRQVYCRETAWNMFRNGDFRIRKCSNVTMNDLFIIHHEMGHIQYFMEYANLSFLYQEGANPGFHEAVGDTVSLSISSIDHLHKIGLIPTLTRNKELEISQLFHVALTVLPQLAFSYFHDLWQWRIYRGEITMLEFNTKWWEMREQFQGVGSPSPRTKYDFDPGIIYHVATGWDLIMYFIAQVLRFQFHRSLCSEAGRYVPKDPRRPLHRCDITGSKEAGKLLRDMMRLGASRPWPEALRVITKGRTNKLDAEALLEYFEPLYEYLQHENLKNGEFIGWRDHSVGTTLSCTAIKFATSVLLILLIFLNG